VLQLHSFDAHRGHGPIGDPRDRPFGNGVLLWFELEDFEAAVERSALMGAEVVRPRHRIPPMGEGGPGHWEICLHDPDGYTIVLASPDESAAPPHLNSDPAPECPTAGQAQRPGAP
jgi:predicted enzyme related to lactoylglutathione lyase